MLSSLQCILKNCHECVSESRLLYTSRALLVYNDLPCLLILLLRYPHLLESALREEGEGRLVESSFDT